MFYDLPTTVNIDGKEYAITGKGDYRVIFDCIAVLNDMEIPENYRAYGAMLIFYEDLNDKEIEDIPEFFGNDENVLTAVKEMYSFFNCGQTHIGKELNYKLIDWEQDAQMIFAAVNTVAEREVRNPADYLHWWTFMGYYMSVGESVLSTVVSIRHKLVKGKTKDIMKYEKDFIRENPQYFTWNSKTAQQQKEDEEFLKQWYGG